MVRRRKEGRGRKERGGTGGEEGEKKEEENNTLRQMKMTMQHTKTYGVLVESVLRRSGAINAYVK